MANKKDSSFTSAAKDTKKIMDKIDIIATNIIKIIDKGIKNIIKNFIINNKLNIKFILEFIIKILIILCLSILIKSPYVVINNLINSIFISPISKSLTIIWKIISYASYILLCFLSIILLFNKYFISKKELKKTIELLKQVLMTVFFLVPIWIINLLLVLTIIFIIYLFFKGVQIFAIFILLISLSILLGFLADTINKFIYTHKQVNFMPFIFSSILLLISSILFIYNNNFNYIENNYNIKEKVYEKLVNEQTKLNFKNKNIIIDDSLIDGNIIIKIKYTDFININLEDKNNEYILNIEKTKTKKELLNLIVDDLKNNRLCNYSSLYEPNVEIYSNRKTLKIIKKA